LVRAKATLGLDVNLEQLESAIDARFGVDGVVRLLGQVDVRNLMSSVEGIRLIERDGQIRVQDELGKPREDEPRPEAVRLEGQVFRRYPGQQWGLLRDSKGTVRYFRQSFVRRGQWKNVKEGSVVAFKPDSNSDGDIAIDIDVLRQGDVRDVVRSVALEIVRSASDAGVVLTKRTLVQKLRNSLRGDIPGLTTGPGGGLEPLLKEADGISFHGDGDQRTVRTNHTRAIGRLPDGGRVEPVVPKHQAATAMGPRPKRAPIDPTAVGNAVKEILSRESTRGLSLQTLGARLKDAFPVKGPLAKHLGTSTFEKFLAQLEGVRLQALRPGMTIASLAAGQSKDQSPLEGKRVPARASETPTESQAVPGAGGERSDLQTIVDFIADLVDTRENTGRPLKLAELAGYLGKKFQLNNARASALGFRSVKALIATVPGIFFTKGEFDLIVRRVR
jgi:hypothetical protein